MNTDYSFIKTRRKELKMTQQQLAEKVGVSAAYIQQLENNVKTQPSFEVFIKIMTALKLNINDIKGLKEAWKDKLVHDIEQDSNCLDNLNCLSKLTQAPINALLGVPEISKDILEVIDKDKELKKIKDYFEKNKETINSVINTLTLTGNNAEKINKSLHEENFNQNIIGDIKNLTSMIETLPIESNNIFEMAEKFRDLKTKNYTKLYLIKKNIINILNILDYDVNGLSKDFINDLVTIIIKNIDFEMFNLNNKNKSINKIIKESKDNKTDITYDNFETVAAHNDNLTNAEIEEADRRILEDINKKNTPST